MASCTSPSPSSHPLFPTLLSFLLILGIVISYLPQHSRIIKSGSSEGLSPWYLLLGSTSSASAMLNVGMLQVGVMRCCRVVSPLSCTLSLLPLLQVFLVWLLFSLNLVLYLIYFPRHLKYVGVVEIAPTASAVQAGGEADERTALLGSVAVEGETQRRMEEGSRKSVLGGKGKVRLETTKEWKLAVVLAGVVAAHLSLLLTISLLLTMYLPPSHPLLTTFPSFLGLFSTLLAILQYAPQLLRTYRTRLVGALSVSTMAIQVPGSGAFVLSMMLAGGGEGKGLGWSSWLTYAVSGVMQGALLIMCLAWKRRQRNLGQDDFGRPLSHNGSSAD